MSARQQGVTMKDRSYRRLIAWAITPFLACAMPTRRQRTLALKAHDS